MAQLHTSADGKTYLGSGTKTEKNLPSNVADMIEKFDLEARYLELREKVENLSERTVSLAKKHPVYTILGVAGVAVAVGMIFSRRK